MNSKRTVPVTVTIAIIAMFFVMGHYSAVNSIIQKMIEAFPDASVSTVRLASTLPSLFGLIFGLIFGAIAGKKIKFKPLMLLSLCLIGVGGILPLWWNSKIAYVLIARAIQGIGVGASMPANAIVIRVYPADIRARMLGFASFSMALGNAVASFITGWLGDRGWEKAFAIYFLAIISFVIVLLFMKEPASDEEAAKENAGEADQAATPVVSGGSKFKPWLYPIIIMLAVLLMYPFMLGVATFISDRGLGTAAAAGTVLSVYMIGSAVSGLVFGALDKALKRFALPVFWGLMAVGVLLALFANSFVMVAIGGMLLGFGNASLIPCLTNYMPYDVPDPSKQSFFATLIYVSTQVGVFLSTYWILAVNSILSGLGGTDVEKAFWACVIISAAFAVIFLFVDIRAKSLREMSK